MGIPCYFSDIVKNHPHIIKKLASLPIVHNLYMDTNGLIYDAVRVIGSNRGISDDDYETAIIDMVCQRIKEYVSLLKPTNNVLIAFDGVAPVAKLNQQRERRYKSWFTSIVERTIQNKVDAASSTSSVSVSGDTAFDKMKQSKDINKAVHRAWNTSSITPGTLFMSKLNTRMTAFILSQEREAQVDSCDGSPKQNPLRYIYSGSNDAGEGEHKIFEYIRGLPEYHKETSTLIYGLDADLIMLCLNHLHISENIYLFRDTPDFIQSLDSTLSKDESYFLDIPTFACSLEKLMRETKEKGTVIGTPTQSKKDQSSKITPEVVAAIDDYILMTFLLGNDFMPHFPALNLRTTGMNVLLQAYAHVFRDSSAYLVRRESIHGKQSKYIEWKNVRLFVESIAKQEHDLIMNEHKVRDRQSKRFGGGGGGGGGGRQGQGQGQGHSRREQHVTVAATKPTTSIDLTDLTSVACDRITDMVSSNDRANTMNDFMTIPLQERSIEKYIDPFRENWEARYYDSLLDINVHEDGGPERLRQICVNYMEGLEWTLKYYSNECIDWRWTYKYAYAPLLSDLIRYIPHMNVSMIESKPKHPIRELVQLCYVLPMASHHLLPPNIAERIKKQLSHYYSDKLEFKWSYCKYFWEAHTELPHIRISDLESVIAGVV